MIEFDETVHIRRAECRVCGENIWYASNQYQCVVCRLRSRREYYDTHQEQERARNSQWKTDNPEKVAKIRENFVKENPDYHAEWQRSNTDKVAEYGKRYRSKNKDEINRKARERRARERQAKEKDELQR